jgi:hypothetical protein
VSTTNGISLANFTSTTTQSKEMTIANSFNFNVNPQPLQTTNKPVIDDPLKLVSIIGANKPTVIQQTPTKTSNGQSSSSISNSKIFLQMVKTKYFLFILLSFFSF